MEAYMTGLWAVFSLVPLLLVSACEGAGTSKPGPFDTAAQVRPDLLVAKPAAVPAGELLELTFPEKTERGVPWVLQEQDGETWHARYLLWSDANGATPDWAGENDKGRWGWDDVGIGGSGPDVVRIPDTASPGHYRLCTANALDNFCSEIEITG